MRGLGLRIGIIVVIAIGAYVLRPFLTGSAGDLKVGDCFDPPTAAGQTVKDVQHHPCTDLHGAEVVFVGKYPDASAYPADSDFQQYVTDKCVPAFQAYTGIDISVVTGADMGFFSPTSDGWTKGDRTVICYAGRTDGAQTKGSIKKS